jgi:hypothetical protein
MSMISKSEFDSHSITVKSMFVKQRCLNWQQTPMSAANLCTRSLVLESYPIISYALPPRRNLPRKTMLPRRILPRRRLQWYADNPDQAYNLRYFAVKTPLPANAVCDIGPPSYTGPCISPNTWCRAPRRSEQGSYGTLTHDIWVMSWELYRRVTVSSGHVGATYQYTFQ